ncbi:MAG: HAD family phosphatase [Candidatus Omnitrophota bacterium]|jgi:beta-phosphoglucomutase
MSIKNKLKSRPKAIIFDMDGVIIDSMPYHFIAWYEALRQFGVRVSCFDVYLKEGERWDKTLNHLLFRAERQPTPDLLKEIFSLRQKIFRKYFKRFIFKDVVELLSCLKKKGYLLGLVTGTPRREIERILPVPIRRLFDHVVAGDQVKEGKPHPEPYLKAAKSLKVKPKECVVIENAPFGIESAKRAHMFCIALTTSLPREYLRGADMVVNELKEISRSLDLSCWIRE